MHCKHLMLCAIFLGTISHASGQEKVPYVTLENGYNQPMKIWYGPADADDWIKPAIQLPKIGTSSIEVRSKCEYYMVARDMAGNEDHLPKVNLYKLSTKMPHAKLRLEGSYVAEKREERYVEKGYAEMEREETRKVLVRIREVGTDGVIRYRNEVREERYRYLVLVPVQRLVTRFVLVGRLKINLTVFNGSKYVPLDDYLNEGERIKIPSK